MMKNKDWHHSIQFKIFLVFAMFLLGACVCLFGLFAMRFRNVYRQQASSHMADVESLAAENVSELLNLIDQLTVSVLVNQTVQDNLAYMNKETLENGVENDSSQFYKMKDEISSQLRGSVFNLDGVISLRIYSLSGIETFIGTTNREYLEYSLTPEEIYKANGAALWEMTGEKYYICVCRAILSTTTMIPQGYMVLVCRNSYFSERLSMMPMVYSGRVYLLDHAEQIVASNDTNTLGEILSLSETSWQTIEDPSTGERSYYNVSSSLDNGWKLVTTVSSERFWQTVRVSVIHMSLLFVTVLAASLAFTLLAIRRLVAPTQDLLQSMQAFGEGNLDARVDYESRDEIGKIGKGYNQMADNIQNLLEKVYSLELANKEAEIEFLKMQINPHFLYNTLDTISWLGYINGSEEISDLAVSLAELLRSSIKSGDIITVREELQTVQGYLRIQRYRFEDRFSVEYDVSEDACFCYMPNFLLQPLIENSIMHGLENQLKKGVLRIQIHREDWLYFTVSDNGKGIDKEQIEQLMKQCKDMKSRTAIGLKNVYRRLQLLYGKDCRFVIESALDQGTIISFRIPVITQEGSEE